MKYELDDDVITALQNLAVPFQDSPSDVIRRLLNNTVSKQSTQLLIKERSERPQRENMTSQNVYAEYLLKCIRAAGGSIDSTTGARKVLEMMIDDNILTETDLATMQNGKMRAENMVTWAIRKLKQTGKLGKSAKRGTWSLTKRGNIHV
jgi:hypothetical protein